MEKPSQDFMGIPMATVAHVVKLISILKETGQSGVIELNVLRGNLLEDQIKLRGNAEKLLTALRYQHKNSPKVNTS